MFILVPYDACKYITSWSSAGKVILSKDIPQYWDFWQLNMSDLPSCLNSKTFTPGFVIVFDMLLLWCMYAGLVLVIAAGVLMGLVSGVLLLFVVLIFIRRSSLSVFISVQC